MSEEPSDELSPRAEIFRSKLIEDFQLLDIINDKGKTESPKYYSNEITDDDVMCKMLKESPQGLIKFQMYSKKEEQKFNGDRRLNRLKNKNSIPLGPWAHTVVEDPRVQNFMMFLIITNSVVLGMQAEISKVKDESLYGLKLTLEIFDYCALTMFVLEIVVKWIDGFWVFWENGWNIFDFFVTVMSFVPEIIEFSSGKSTTAEVSVIGQNLRVFRILRSLKMVSRFAQLRIIVLTILKAFKSMVFILILLGLFMYIFAVAGTVMFDALDKSDRNDLRYKKSFSSLGNALLTVFQIFTLDHWYAILKDIVKVVNHITAKIYVILWICIGAFIFRNIFAGIMVMNFQNIRDDFNQHVLEQTQAIEAQQMRYHLAEELERQDKMHTKTRRTSSLGPTLYQSADNAQEVQAAHLATLAEISESEAESDTSDGEGEGEDGESQEPRRVEKETSGQEKTDGVTQVTAVEEDRKEIDGKKKEMSKNKEGEKEKGKKQVTDGDKKKQEIEVKDVNEKVKDKVKVGEKRKEKPETETGTGTTTTSENMKEKVDDKKIKEPDVAIDPLAALGDKLAKLRKSKLSGGGTASTFTDESAGADGTELHFGDLNRDEGKECSTDWNQTVASNLTHLKGNLIETLWPRDSLFRYLQLMESLQENLAERQQLLQLAAQALARLHDTASKTQ